MPKHKTRSEVTPEIPREGNSNRPVIDSHEELARLAYQHWMDRGCPNGSPDVDWIRAEEDLRKRQPRARGAIA